MPCSLPVVDMVLKDPEKEEDISGKLTATSSKLVSNLCKWFMYDNHLKLFILNDLFENLNLLQDSWFLPTLAWQLHQKSQDDQKKFAHSPSRNANCPGNWLHNILPTGPGWSLMVQVWKDTTAKCNTALHMLWLWSFSMMICCDVWFHVAFFWFRASGPVDCKSLQNKMAVVCKRTEDSIMNTWFPKVIHLLTSDTTLKGVKEEKLDAFYDCASTLISNQVKWCCWLEFDLRRDKIKYWN